jgi:pilus assembly protein Flp/PilA
MFSISATKKQEKGQGLVEYAIIIALIAIVTIGVMSAMGGKVKSTFEWASSNLDAASSGVTPYNATNYPVYQDAVNAFCTDYPESSYYTIYSSNPPYISQTNDSGSGSPGSCP